MRTTKRWDLWLAGAGLLLGVLDTSLLWTLGVQFALGGRDATLLVGAFFTSSFGVLGYAVGALACARTRARDAEATIRAQLLALEASQRALVQHEKLAAIGRLAAGVAHEVRNPLSVIRASAAMLRENFDAASEPHRACQFILEEIDRLNGLIGSLLAFARPAEPRLQSVSLEKALDRALQLASEELRRRAIEVERSSDGGAPEVRADPDLVAQVLLGLLINAAEAIGERGRIAVRIGAHARELRVEVADDGPGVAPEDAARVFEPFFTTKPAGTGLGLAMALRIAEAHGGALELVAGAGGGPGGRGACFRLRLPIDGPKPPGRCASDAGA